jgi:DNA-binding Xre family transcriptional regulator
MKMTISYMKLWHLLLDRHMTKLDLKRLSGVSTASIAKLGKGENIQTDVLLKICNALEVGIHVFMGTAEVLQESIDDD